MDSRGLYLLPEPVQRGGRITEVCVLGYPRRDHQILYVDEETGGLDLDSKIHGFVYFVLYRPNPTNALYQMEYSPVLVYHQLEPGCVSQKDGLQMRAEKGDLLGAIISDNCTTAEYLVSQDDLEIFNEMEVRELEFCPAQISLRDDSDQCSYAEYFSKHFLRSN